MKTVDQAMAKRLKAARKSAGLDTAADAARFLGMNAATYSGHENGNRGFGHEAAALYARRFGVRPEWLLYGTGRMTEGEPTVISIAKVEQNDHGIDDSFTVNGSREAPQDAFFATVGAKRRIAGSILEADVRPGAGEGALGEVVSFAIGNEIYSAHAVTGEWVIPLGTLQHHLHLEASSSLVLRITGDSMEPTFRSGDPVLVDLRVRGFEDDGVYVFSEPGEAPRIKRLQKVPRSDPKAVRIISDNKTYETFTVDLSSIIIHGRVGAVVIPK